MSSARRSAVVRDAEIADIDVAHRRCRVVLAQAIHERPARDAEEPGAELRAVAKTVETPQDAEPHVLDDLVRHLVAVGQPAHVLPDWSAPPGYQLVEGGHARRAGSGRPAIRLRRCTGGTRVRVVDVGHGSFRPGFCSHLRSRDGRQKVHGPELVCLPHAARGRSLDHTRHPAACGASTVPAAGSAVFTGGGGRCPSSPLAPPICNWR